MTCQPTTHQRRIPRPNKCSPLALAGDVTVGAQWALPDLRVSLDDLTRTWVGPTGPDACR